MDKMVKARIAILNLTGGLSLELVNYFAQKQILVVDPELDNSAYEWTHILTKGLNDFTVIRATYDTVEKDVRIISLTSVDDVQHFVESNGKLILDELWMQNQLGSFILDKFLQEYGGISLGDNYPTFKEKGSFNITNPFNTGEYLDQLVQSAYKDGISGLSIKTFFDHLVMYLTGLKTKGKLGMPIEVTYGYFQEIFGVQLHFFTKDLILEDVTSSLSSNISKKAEKYLLNIAIQSSDFFDFTLLTDVNKTVITGLWTKDERIKVENKGILFNELSASAPITNYPTEGITSFQMNDFTFEDFSAKVILPGSVNEVVTSETVKGAPAEKVEARVIHGTDIEDEMITVVKGKIEEEEQVFRVSGSKDFDVDKFAYRISAGIVEKGKGDDILKIKSVKSELPEAIKTSFNAFTARLNKSIDDISEADLDAFKEFEVPKIIKQTTKKVDNTFKIQAPSEEKVLLAENETLKSKIKMLMSEVRILKESKAQMAEIREKAKISIEAAAKEIPVVDAQDDAFKSQMIRKMQDQKSLNEQDTKKLAALMERENKYLKEAKEHEIHLKKLQIETVQKETLFSLELEKLNRQVKAKDLIVNKTKEGLGKLVEQKDAELRNLNDKLNVASKALASNQTQNQANQIRELERKVINSEKMIEIYKNKITQKPAAKVDDEVAKEESRRLTMLNNQFKNQLDLAKKDITKYQERTSQDTAALNLLKADKNRLEALLKKSIMEAKREEASPAGSQHEFEMKKLQSQYDILESQHKDTMNRFKEVELKLQDALKLQKKEIIADDQNTKGKTAHLEGNVRKLTGDLVEAKNQLAEMKKETNKLRQDKTALQNLIDKYKKEADKTKAAAPKKPGTGGKAA